ncbi:unnamed protein product [Cuscuta campestris]|uniref:Uncharacterized protein n=1 Tax=Cuscuta campestris TaxID=132261 RepID=A0A484KT27_9ASTE|nr:unnamed protein product [Cuscuta campestris]
MYDVLPGTSNCPGFVYFHSRANSRGFLTGLPPSHKKWKQRFVFIEFLPDQFPLSNREWADQVIKPERVHPVPTKELEDACEKLLKGDPSTGKPYAYGGWVYRLSNPDGGMSATHDAEDDRANSPDGHAEGSSPHPATHLSENDRVPSPKKDVKAKGKETGHSSSHKRKGSHKTSKGEKKKKVRLSDLKGESIEVGVLSEEVGRSLLESKDQVSELTLLLDSAKLEINDRVEREKRLEEELKEERARLDEERAKLVEEKRKVAELEEALGQAEESARAKEQSFPDDAATWAACHHTEVARSILIKYYGLFQDHVQGTGRQEDDN